MVKGTEPKGTRCKEETEGQTGTEVVGLRSQLCLTDLLDRKAKGESVPALAAASGRNRATIFRYIRILTAPARSATGFLLLF